MKKRIGALAFAALLIGAGGASAQSSGNTEGTVAYVDLKANTITFTDGRIVHFDPRSRIIVNGKEVTLGEVRPGAMGVLMPGASTPVVAAPAPATITTAPAPSTTTVVPGPSVPAAATARSYSGIEVSGKVAAVDAATGIVTFQDGRMVRISSGQVWQQVGLAAIQPGTDVLVSNGTPVGYRSTLMPTWTERDVMGRVLSVDPGANQVMLSDGTIVTVSPSTKMALAGGQTLTVGELRPGDQVVVRVTPSGTAQVTSPGVVTSGHSVNTLPGTGYRARLSADQVVIIRQTEGR